MKKVYKKLTKDQKARGVIFSSTLSKYTTETIEDTMHEVTKENLHDTFGTDRDKIELLKDDKFFNNGPWKYNIIRK